MKIVLSLTICESTSIDERYHSVAMWYCPFVLNLIWTILFANISEHNKSAMQLGIFCVTLWGRRNATPSAAHVCVSRGNCGPFVCCTTVFCPLMIQFSAAQRGCCPLHPITLHSCGVYGAPCLQLEFFFDSALPASTPCVYRMLLAFGGNWVEWKGGNALCNMCALLGRRNNLNGIACPTALQLCYGYNLINSHLSSFHLPEGQCFWSPFHALSSNTRRSYCCQKRAQCWRMCFPVGLCRCDFFVCFFFFFLFLREHLVFTFSFGSAEILCCVASFEISHFRVFVCHGRNFN